MLRVSKEDCAMVFTASQPFTSKLVMSNIKIFKHEWKWFIPTKHMNEAEIKIKEGWVFVCYCGAYKAVKPFEVKDETAEE